MQTMMKTLRGRLAIVGLLAALIPSRHAAASGHGHAKPADHGTAKAPAEDHAAAPEETAGTFVGGTFVLGDFHLRNFRPSHNETASIRFTLHVIPVADAKPVQLEELQRWHRRLRDQAIVAVRSAEAADLAEPELARVQRLVLIRLKRLAVANLIAGVYLTDFSVGDG
jgi:hypothetical protein